MAGTTREPAGTFRTSGFASRALADWACRARFEHLSPDAVERAKLLWLDSLGCALGGSGQEDAHILLEHHREMHPGPGACRIFVSGAPASPVDAAFLNSHLVRAMDFNDIYWKADPCHPSDIICGPLALCELRGLSGGDLLLATAIAYEVEMRLCEIGRPGIREYGWHHATLTAVAAPLACARVLGLSPEQAVNAVGIAASRTCTLGAVTAGRLTPMKNMVDPWATRMGVEGALLAERGCAGPEHVIDGKEGLVHVLGHARHHGEPCTFDVDALLADLPCAAPDHWRILDCGMKSFPIEALSHAPLTAMLRCVREHSIRAEDVEEISVEVIARAADILGDPAKYRPATRETADHSLPYSLAVGLVDGMVTPRQFREERVRDASLHAVMDRVKVVPNTEFESLFPRFQPSRVTIRLRDGSTRSTRVDVPRGDPRDPMTRADVAEKFRSLGEGVLSDERLSQVEACVMSLEREPRADRLVSLMVR
jgi:2-methylcitrate dehydratase